MNEIVVDNKTEKNVLFKTDGEKEILIKPNENHTFCTNLNEINITVDTDANSGKSNITAFLLSSLIGIFALLLDDISTLKIQEFMKLPTIAKIPLGEKNTVHIINSRMPCTELGITHNGESIDYEPQLTKENVDRKIKEYKMWTAGALLPIAIALLILCIVCFLSQSTVAIIIGTGLITLSLFLMIRTHIKNKKYIKWLYENCEK